ncbi:helix-turn-helix domain-containing protein [bacterium]|nr:helix-turn-helix domain-containing protein [bacterium]
MNPNEIKILRQQLNLSQEKFATILGVSFATVNRWEKGHNQPCGKALSSLNMIKSVVEGSKVVKVSNLIGSLTLKPLSVFMPVSITETLAELILTKEK